jgi:hypothetical protein
MARYAQDRVPGSEPLEGCEHSGDVMPQRGYWEDQASVCRHPPDAVRYTVAEYRPYAHHGINVPTEWADAPRGFYRRNN